MIEQAKGVLAERIRDGPPTKPFYLLRRGRPQLRRCACTTSRVRSYAPPLYAAVGRAEIALRRRREERS